MAETKNTNLTPQDRAKLFAMQTRQNMQMLAKQTLTGALQTAQFNLPKARLLSNIYLKVKAKVKVTHASKTVLPVDNFTPYRLFRKISLDLNNGFSPFSISGLELAMYNLTDLFGSNVFPKKSAQSYTYLPEIKASTVGTETEIGMTFQLPVTINDRDSIGLILLQNEQTNVTLTCDIGSGAEFANFAEGFTVDVLSVEISPMCTTFSIPAYADAYPDLSVLKLVTGRNDALPSGGQHIVKLSTGTIYRKILFMIEDTAGNPLTDAEILSNIDLIFNQADINYSITAEMLRTVNTEMYGYQLPDGMYALDFASMSGLPNYSGTRDYVDTERLTEMWLRFNTQDACKVRLVTECLARLQ